MDLTPAQGRILLDVARAVIRSRLRGQADASLPAVEDPVLLQPAGCFVTLHDLRSRRLRGCIGRLQSPAPLLHTVRDTAAGVLEDPRFAQIPVTLDELPRLELEISVLSPLVTARDVLDFEPLKHGIYLVFGDRSGCFLPQVARETGWTREQLLDRLCAEKLGMSEFIWRNPHARLHRFTVSVLGPEPFVPPPEPTRGPPPVQA